MSELARAVMTGLPSGCASSTRSRELVDGWSCLRTPPGAFAVPSDLPDDAPWLEATVPGTVACVFRHLGLDDHDDYDQFDWWYRCPLPELTPEEGDRTRLRFDGLATLAEVWLDDCELLRSANMFVAWTVPVPQEAEQARELIIVFRSLAEALRERRPRPRWKTRLVDEQGLRWHRTTLLGRIPGWTPAIPPVGPWRPVSLETSRDIEVESLGLRPRLEGSTGIVDVHATLAPLSNHGSIEGATLHVGEHQTALDVSEVAGSWEIQGALRVDEPALWWPRTHGEPSLYDCRLEVETSGRAVTVDGGAIGFRSVEVDRSDGDIHFRVNGVEVFCRGGCWTTNDIVSLAGGESEMVEALDVAAESNVNMVRVGGTMVYETDAFYSACDRLGLMVWQDFMFANMDYPTADDDFMASARVEVEQQVERLGRHPCVVAFCGGSEVEQQAAMVGVPERERSNELFSVVIPQVVADRSPGTPYWTSTPTGGAMPFHVGEGLAHYYGVGAYRRGVDSVRSAGVRFAPECLGFSNIPEPSNLRLLSGHAAGTPGNREWKSGVPRDGGASWDFEDVRDHYLEQRYALNARQTRSDTPEEYLRLSRVVTGEVMERVMDEWRFGSCGGAMVWYLNDLRAGAGWGIIDSTRRPKAVLHYLRRAWAPRTVRLLDRGLDGLTVAMFNDLGHPLDATLDILVVGARGVVLDGATRDVHVPPRSRHSLSLEGELGRFLDPTYSYRFGPPRLEMVSASLMGPDGDLIASDVYRPIPAAMTSARALAHEILPAEDGDWWLTLESDTPLYGVRVEARDHDPGDNYFHLIPGRPRRIALTSRPGSHGPVRGYIEALNLSEAVRFRGEDES